jgi:diguanylate cyclase (GGDEF)-like protein
MGNLEVEERAFAFRLRLLLLAGSEDIVAELQSVLDASESAVFEVTHAPDLEQVLDSSDSPECDAIVLVVTGPEGEGLAELSRIRDRFRNVPVVVLADSDDENLALDAVNVGAQGYLLRRKLDPLGVVTVIAAAVGNHRAILKLTKTCEHEHHLATHDPLTGLANRALFDKRLSQALASAKRNKRRSALLLISLDRFRSVNERQGQAVGNGVLKSVARRVAACVGKTDTAARLGSDEFAVVMGQAISELHAIKVADKILESIRKPLAFSNEVLNVTASIGVSLFPRDGVEADDLIQKANVAMHEARKSGGGCVEYYTDAIAAAIQNRAKMENRLQTALDERQLVNFYQPQLDIRTGRIMGAESLIRWQDPERGLIPPSDFLPLAEETGLIVPIGEWVLREACNQLAVWHGEGHKSLRMSVNVASEQFQKPDFGDLVQNTLDESGIPAISLELEITETSLLQDVELTERILASLKELGVRLAIDDFGTGYSSLAYLKRLPIDVLKIDRAFVSSIATDPTDATLTATIVTMARALGLTTVAEGVETSEQLLLLGSYGCSRMQGYLIGKPVPAETFTEWLVNPPFQWMQPQDGDS